MIRDIQHIEFELRACKVKKRAIMTLIKLETPVAKWANEQLKLIKIEYETLKWELQISKEINQSFILNPNYHG